MQVANEAAAVLLEVVRAFSSPWDSETWQSAFSGPLSYLFELPKTQLAADEDETAVVSRVFPLLASSASCMLPTMTSSYSFDSTEKQDMSIGHDLLQLSWSGDVRSCLCSVRTVP